MSYFLDLRAELVGAADQQCDRRAAVRRRRRAGIVGASLSMVPVAAAVAAGWVPFTSSDGIAYTAPAVHIAGGELPHIGAWSLVRKPTSEGSCLELELSDPLLPRAAGGCGLLTDHELGVISGGTEPRPSVLFGTVPGEATSVTLSAPGFSAHGAASRDGTAGIAFFVIEGPAELSEACLSALDDAGRTLQSRAVHGRAGRPCPGS